MLFASIRPTLQEKFSSLQQRISVVVKTDFGNNNVQ